MLAEANTKDERRNCARSRLFQYIRAVSDAPVEDQGDAQLAAVEYLTLIHEVGMIGDDTFSRFRAEIEDRCG